MKIQAHETPRVLGTGVLYNGTGNAFSLVSSVSEPGRVHVVEYLAASLACDCRGFQYRGQCSHIDAVHALYRWAVDAERADRVAAGEDDLDDYEDDYEDAEDEAEPNADGKVGEHHEDDQDVVRHVTYASQAATTSGETRDTSGSHPGDTAILRRSNRPFSLYK